MALCAFALFATEWDCILVDFLYSCTVFSDVLIVYHGNSLTSQRDAGMGYLELPSTIAYESPFHCTVVSDEATSLHLGTGYLQLNL